VFVYNGTYVENVVVDKSINLIGEDRNTTIIDGNVIDESSIYINADGVNFSEFTVQNGDSYAIEVFGNNNSILGNIIINNGGGIYIWGGGWVTGYNITIIDNIIKGNYGGGICYNGSSNNNTLSQNIIDSNSYSGVVLTYMAHFNTITENIILNHSKSGIYIDSNHNIVAHNVISNNTCGIRVYNNSNVIFENLISFSEIGIKIFRWQYKLTDNYIYHNNFIDNDQQAYDDGINTWDNGYPSGGNYWDDYTGNDSNGDGIGDTPYLIPGGNNEDRYPLMKPWNFSNKPPYPPDIIGPKYGRVGINYNYTVPGFDPDGNHLLRYVVDWGEGIITICYGPVPSGTEIDFHYSWNKTGFYTIRARVDDIYGAKSNWTTMKVSIPKDHKICCQEQLEMFPLLNQLIMRIMER